MQHCGMKAYNAFATYIKNKTVALRDLNGSVYVSYSQYKI